LPPPQSAVASLTSISQRSPAGMMSVATVVPGMPRALALIGSAAREINARNGVTQFEAPRNMLLEALGIMREGEKYAVEGTGRIPAAWPALNGLGLLAHHAGDYEGADKLLREAVDGVQRCAKDGLAHDSFVDLSGCINDVAANYIAAGDWAAAHKFGSRAIYMAERAYRPDLRTLSALRSNLAMTALLQGQHDEALSLSTLALQGGGTLAQLQPEEAAVSKAVNAEAHLALGNLDMAKHMALEAVEALAQEGPPVSLMMVRLTGARVSWASQEGTEDALRSSLEIADTLNDALGSSHLLTLITRSNCTAMGSEEPPDWRAAATKQPAWVAETLGKPNSDSRPAGMPMLHLRVGEALRRLYGETFE